MTYSLRRINPPDNAGDSGTLSVAFNENDQAGGHRPKVGYAMAVGSSYPRTYQMQDWWQTTAIEEILEDTPNRVVFRTRNSIYEWKEF